MKTHAQKMRRKNESITILKDCFERAKIAILTDYRGEKSGLTVKEITDLRKRLREHKGEYRVVKNTMVKLATRELGIEGLDDYLKGPVAIAFGYDDPAAVTKTILEFAKENKEKKLPQVKTGLMDGKILSHETLDAIASLPTKDELMQKLLGLMLAPHRAIMNIMNAPGRQIATVLDAWSKKQEESAA